jgi:Zn-dependent alcohol dehydrogenase
MLRTRGVEVGRESLARTATYDVSALDEINSAFDLMHEGKSIRSVVTF